MARFEIPKRLDLKNLTKGQLFFLLALSSLGLVITNPFEGSSSFPFLLVTMLFALSRKTAFPIGGIKKNDGGKND